MTTTTTLVPSCPVCANPLDGVAFCSRCRYRSQVPGQRFLRSGWMLVSGGVLATFLLFAWSRQVAGPLHPPRVTTASSPARPDAPLPAPRSPVVLPFAGQRCVPWELPAFSRPGDADADPGILVVTSRVADSFGLTLSGVADECGLKVRSVVLEDLPAGDLSRAVARHRPRLLLTVGGVALQRARDLGGSLPILFTQVTQAPGATAGQMPFAGISFSVPIPAAVAHWLDVLPVNKPLALIYSARAQAEAARAVQEEIGKRGRALLLLGLESTSELDAALARASQMAGGWIVLPDPELVSWDLFGRILVAAEGLKIPVAVPDEEHVRSGTLLGVGLDRAQIGRQACRLARVMLAGKLPGTDRVFCPQVSFLTYNVTVAEKLGVMADPVLLSRAKIFKWH